MGLGFGGLPLGLGGGSPSVTPTLVAQNAIGAETFGTDIFFNGSTLISPSGDYTTVSGVENLRRSILRRMITAPGEYKLNPTYGVGLPVYIKKPMTQSNLDQISNRIKDNLSRDPRIDQVITLDVQKTTFNGQTGIQINLVVSASGNNVRFQPFTFTRST